MKNLRINSDLRGTLAACFGDYAIVANTKICCCRRLRPATDKLDDLELLQPACPVLLVNGEAVHQLAPRSRYDS